MGSQADPGRQGRVLIGAGLVLVTTLLWGGIAWDLRHERQQAMATASRAGANLARTIGAHFTNIAQGVDHELVMLRSELMQKHGVSALAAQPSPSWWFPRAEWYVVDAQGRSVPPFNVGVTRTVDVSEEFWFRAHADRPTEDRLIIGNPVMDKPGWEPRVHFSRPFMDREGRFAGVIALGVPPWELNRIHEGIDLGQGGTVTLRRPDGTVLTRSQDFSHAIKLPPMSLYDFSADRRKVGEFIRTSPVDGIERLFSFWYLPQHDLGVVVGQPLTTVYAAVQESQLMYVLMGGAITVLLVLAALSFARSRRRMAARAQDSRASADRFRSLVELSTDAYWELDREFRFVSLEGGQESGLSARRALALGRRVWEQDYVNMSAEDWARHRAVLEAHQPFRDVEVCRLDKAGQEYWLSISGEPVFDAAGTFTGYRGVSRDVRSIKSAQRRRELESRVSHALAVSTGETDTVQAVLRAVCSTGEGARALTYGEYWQVDPVADVLRLRTSWMSPDASEAIKAFHAHTGLRTFRKGEGLVGRVWQSGESEWVRDGKQDPRLSAGSAIRASGLQGGALFPVKADDGSVMGVMGFPTEHVRVPDQVMIDAMRVIGTQLGQFLRNMQSEHSLRESEARFRSLVEISADTYWELDADFRFVFLDGGSPEWRSLRRPAMYGRTRWELDYVNLSEDEWRAHRALLEAREPFRDLELCRVDGKGREHWIIASGDPIFDPAGKFLGYRGVTHDITRRKRAEALRAIEHSVTRSLAAGESEPAALEAVLRSFCELRYGLQFGEYWHVDVSAEIMQLRASWVAPNADARIREFVERSRTRVFRSGEGLVGEVWRTGEPLWIDNAIDDPRTLRRDEARASGLPAGFLFPIIAESRTVGVMAFPSATALEPDLPLLEATRAIGLQVGQYLHRKEAERILRESEARARSLLSLSFENYWETDSENRFTKIEGGGPDWSQALWPSMIGRARWEVPGAVPGSGDWSAHWADLAAHRPFRDFELSRKDSMGREQWFSITGEPRFDDGGNFIGYRGVAKVITERKRIERVLRESEERFRGLTELSSDWYWEQDTQYRFTRIVGPAQLPIDEMLGKTRWELAGTRVTEEEWRAHRETLDAHKPFRDFINRFRNPDGSEIRTSVSGQPILAEDGTFVGYRGTARNVTDTIRREEELVRFRTAIDASADLVFLIDPVSMAYIDVNDAACRRLGYSREELLALGPADIFYASRADLGQTYRRLIDGDDQVSVIEGWYRCKDGSRLPVEAFRRALRTQNGDAIVAVARDISARIEAERRAKERDTQQGVIASLGQRALAEQDLQAFREHVTLEVRRTLGTDFCSLFEADQEAGWFILVAGAGYEPGWVGRRIIEVDSNSSPAIAIRTREPVMVEDFRASAAPRGAELGRAHGVRSSIHTPILLGDGTVYGTMGVHAREPRWFNEEQKTFLKSVTNILAAAIERARSQERLARLAQFDTTTGLPNRSLFRDRLEQMLVQARRNRWNAAVMFVDLDRFKLVNDTLGHAYGDTLLVRVAERLSGAMRAGDTVGRLSGDEFAVALANIAHAEDAALVAQKLLEVLSVPFDLGGHKSYVTGSIGIAVYPGDGDDADTLLKNADTAMYRVKAGGRNAYQFYLPAMNDRAVERFELESDLRGALDRGEFFLLFQAKVRLSDRQIVGFEALLRWRHAVRGVIDPDLFIALLEDTGLIVPVGEWVLAEVCRQIQSWRAAGVEVPEIAVNLSARQLQRRDLDEVVRRILAAHSVSPGLLGLEITESVLMQDTEAAVRTLRTLRDAGVRVYVDDFGTGYSSLSYLSSFPLDALKIDRSFIDGVVKGGDGAAIALAIINLAHSLRLEVIAEGVETREQLEFLRKHRCDTVQGYLFSPPAPAATCERALREGGRLKVVAKKTGAPGRGAAH